MKRILTALWVGFLATTVNANEQIANKETAGIFKNFVIQDNNLNKCLFPEIYRSTDRGIALLDKWWDDVENGGRLKRSHYLKLKRRLAQNIMPESLSEDFLSGELPDELDKQYQVALKKYAKMTTLKGKNACRQVGQYATDLVESYNEVDSKWDRPVASPF
ncbi:hypothetical protein [Rodentibacter genomosp. 2]|uniref:Uncharacterized protein n=1 Tax=Rodentibacter genomosp. 2 TaxID=1908266 RepID=A0A1V3JBG0_9PAST|nr:hypothetical protein [Rodentibacter genomosp. 2]OOF53891.1 hypothetical protein BKK55_10855 [Rodentibacter genomosp. 2]